MARKIVYVSGDVIISKEDYDKTVKGKPSQCMFKKFPSEISAVVWQDGFRKTYGGTIVKKGELGNTIKEKKSNFKKLYGFFPED